MYEMKLQQPSFLSSVFKGQIVLRSQWLLLVQKLKLNFFSKMFRLKLTGLEGFFFQVLATNMGNVFCFKVKNSRRVDHLYS